MEQVKPSDTAQAHLLAHFQKHGLLTSKEVNALHLPRITLTRLIQHGQIERIQRGVYRLNDTSHLPTVDAELEELLELQLRYPHARPCLVSALHLHGLTTTRLSTLQLAIPANRTLTTNTPGIEVFYFTPKHYEHGLTAIEVRGRSLTTYSPEKTICDLLRYAPKFGRELYLEGLRKYLRPTNTHALISMAKQQGLWKKISQDLEVLSHDQDH